MCKQQVSIFFTLVNCLDNVILDTLLISYNFGFLLINQFHMAILHNYFFDGLMIAKTIKVEDKKLTTRKIQLKSVYWLIYFLI